MRKTFTRLFLALSILLLTTACGSMRPHISFGATPIGIVACPLAKALANMTIAQSALCKNPAPAAVAACLSAQTLADQTIMAACGPSGTPMPSAALESDGPQLAIYESMGIVPTDDPQAMMQRIYESVGIPPAEAARKAAKVPRPR